MLIISFNNSVSGINAIIKKELLITFIMTAKLNSN